MDRQSIIELIFRAKDEASKTFKDVGSSASSSLKMIGDAMMTVGPVAAQFADQSLDAFADQQQALMAVGVAYKGTATDWIKWSKEMQAATASSDEAFMRSAVNMLTLKKNYGLTEEQIKTLIGASADLAAMQGLDVFEAVGRVQSAIRGEAEASEYLGLTLNDNYMKNIAFNGALKDQWEKLSDLEKAQYRYQEVLNQAAYAQGTANDYAEQGIGAYKQLTNRLQDMSARVGELVDRMGPLGYVMGDALHMAQELAPIYTLITLRKALVTKATITETAAITAETAVVKGLSLTWTAWLGIAAAVGIAVVAGYKTVEQSNKVWEAQKKAIEDSGISAEEAAYRINLLEQQTHDLIGTKELHIDTIRADLAATKAWRAQMGLIEPELDRARGALGKWHSEVEIGGAKIIHYTGDVQKFMQALAEAKMPTFDKMIDSIDAVKAAESDAETTHEDLEKAKQIAIEHTTDQRILSLQAQIDAEKRGYDEALALAQGEVDQRQTILEDARTRLEETRAGLHGVPGAYDVQAITSEAVTAMESEWKRGQNEVEIMTDEHTARLKALYDGLGIAIEGSTDPMVQKFLGASEEIDRAFEFLNETMQNRVLEETAPTFGGVLEGWLKEGKVTFGEIASDHEAMTGLVKEKAREMGEDGVLAWYVQQKAASETKIVAEDTWAAQKKGADAMKTKFDEVKTKAQEYKEMIESIPESIRTNIDVWLTIHPTYVPPPPP